MLHIGAKDKRIAKNICGTRVQKGNLPTDVKDNRVAKNICGSRVQKGNAPTDVKDKYVAKNTCGRKCFVKRCSDQKE